MKILNTAKLLIASNTLVDPRTVKNPKDLPYMQRAGGSADDSDLDTKKKGFGGFFNFGKKKEPEPEPEPPKKNPWTF